MYSIRHQSPIISSIRDDNNNNTICYIKQNSTLVYFLYIKNIRSKYSTSFISSLSSRWGLNISSIIFKCTAYVINPIIVASEMATTTILSVTSSTIQLSSISSTSKISEASTQTVSSAASAPDGVLTSAASADGLLTSAVPSSSVQHTPSLLSSVASEMTTTTILSVTSSKIQLLSTSSTSKISEASTQTVSSAASAPDGVSTSAVSSSSVQHMLNPIISSIRDGNNNNTVCYIKHNSALIYFLYIKNIRSKYTNILM